MTFDLDRLREATAAHGRVVRIVVVQTAGSVPRAAGTSMLVWEGGQSGTIGGGRLEFEAVAAARRQTHGATLKTVPLGPALGQCCGGSVTLVAEAFTHDSLPDSLPYARQIGPAAATRPDGTGFVWKNGWLIEGAPSPRDIWIYGAGHVGRALVNVLAPLPDVAITWVDTAADRFPNTVAHVTPLVAHAPEAVVGYAPDHAEHLILTYDHQIDFALCHALLQRRFESVGLIGSATKWARFRKRLALLGHSQEEIGRIACPIGETGLGKHPQQIAIGVAMTMLGALADKRHEGAG